jgi:NADH:ubiquinone oxidoreductase subunit H
MRLGWKVFLPMSLGWVVISSALAMYGVPGYLR